MTERIFHREEKGGEENLYFKLTRCIFHFTDSNALSENKKIRALKLLALKVAAHLKWDLDTLNKRWYFGIHLFVSFTYFYGISLRTGWKI